MLFRPSITTDRSAGCRHDTFRGGGFTLVEMLVVIVILLILMSVTVSVVNVSLDGERVRSGSRQLQSLLMGARDRASHANMPRGIRFEVDPSVTRAEDVNNNGQLDAGEDLNGNNSLDVFPVVRSAVYIGANDNWRQGSVAVHRFYTEDLDNDFVLDAGEDANGNGQLDVDRRPCLVRGSFTEWQSLIARGQLIIGSRIRLGSRWYTIDSFANLGLVGVPDPWIVISPPFQESSSSDELFPSSLPRPVVARFGEGDYEVTLMPRVLPNARPVQFPTGVLLDIGLSKLPTIWSNPNFLTRDVMFSPRGSVVGDTGARGVLHFLLNDQVDIIGGRKPLDPANEGDKRIVSLFTRSGYVTTSELFPGTNIWEYAETGATE